MGAPYTPSRLCPSTAQESPFNISSRPIIFLAVLNPGSSLRSLPIYLIIIYLLSVKIFSLICLCVPMKSLYIFWQGSRRNNTGWLFSDVLLVTVTRADKLSAHSVPGPHMCCRCYLIQASQHPMGFMSQMRKLRFREVKSLGQGQTNAGRRQCQNSPPDLPPLTTGALRSWDTHKQSLPP